MLARNFSLKTVWPTEVLSFYNVTRHFKDYVPVS